MKDIRRNDINNQINLLVRLSVYGACIFFFVVNTYAIFLNFSSNPTILSAMVYKPDGGIFNAPSILICSEEEFEEPGLYTDYVQFRNNTLRMEDAMLDVLVIRDISKGILNAKPISILGGVKAIPTAFHGTCYQSHENLQVNYLIIRLNFVLSISSFFGDIFKKISSQFRFR